tara:strand:- start:136 stop:1254 length:1119 start_codon:yes stop_codon:yes gene_type:complete
MQRKTRKTPTTTRKTPTTTRKTLATTTDDNGFPVYSVDSSPVLDILRRGDTFAVTDHSGTRLPPSLSTLADATKSERKLAVRGFIRVECDAGALIDNSTELVRDSAAAVSGEPRKFYGGSLADWNARKYEPDTDAVNASSDMFDEVDMTVDTESVRPTLSSSVVGGAPNVGAFLQGSPMSMYRVTDEVSADGNVARLIVGMNCGGDIPARVLRTRGIACMALARMMQSCRPVELWSTFATQPENIDEVGNGKSTGYTDNGRIYVSLMTRVSLAPFDVSRASRVLADPFYKRGIMHATAQRLAGQSADMFEGFPFPSADFATIVGATSSDVVVPGIYNAGDEIVADPIGWVKREFEKWTTGDAGSLARATWND